LRVQHNDTIVQREDSYQASLEEKPATQTVELF
ncbi:hypothetical protein LCGC14_2576740, partial [marine sediment metagenome]